MDKKNKYRFWKGHLKVYCILLEGPATYKELKEKSRFKDTTLSRILTDLVSQGKAYKKSAKKRSDEKYATFEVDSEQINSQLDPASRLTSLIKSIPHSDKDLIQVTRFMKESKGVEEVAFRANLMLLAAWVLDLIYRCLHDEPEYVHRQVEKSIDGIAKPWIHSLYELGSLYNEMAEKASAEIRDSLYPSALNQCEKYTKITKGIT